MTIPNIQCFNCKHYRTGDMGAIGKETCKAFPNGIPDKIWEGEFDHTEAYVGDNGIRFEPVERK